MARLKVGYRDYTIWKTERKKEWRKNSQRLWGTTKYTNIHKMWMWISEREEKKRAKKHIWRNNSWKLAIFIGRHYTSTNLNKLHRINAERSTNIQTIVKILKAKDREKILRVTREKWLIMFRDPKKINRQILMKTNGDLKAVGQHTRCAQINKQKLSTKNTIYSKAIF